MKLVQTYLGINLIIRIILGLIIGIIFGVLVNMAMNNTGWIFEADVFKKFLTAVSVLLKVLGDLFIGALRAVAPVLVFFLITSSLMSSQKTGSRTIRRIMFIYVLGTFSASIVTVFINTFTSVKLVLPSDIDTSSYSSPSGMTDIIVNIFDSIVQNPIEAVSTANFLGVLFWAIMFGIIARNIASEGVKNAFRNISEIFTAIVRVIIDFAPLGICGLVFTAIVSNGIGIFTDYGLLLCAYLACAFSMFFIFNPLLVFIFLRRNPYPLVFRTIKDVGMTAFFMRSSAANIPMNMKFCEELHLDKSIYSISIPLGSTINMEGAAITIITLTLACCETLGIEMDFGPALILSFVATISAVGASGVSGGSILLVPMACSLFGIGGDIAAGVVSVGFIIGVIQDSVETALNSSTDGLFTATILLRESIVLKKPYHKIVGGTLDDKSKGEKNVNNGE